MFENLLVAFHTLGCKLNFSETSTLIRQFENKKFQITSFDAFADVYVINTCSVTENADKECHKLVRKVMRQNPHAYVIITGCYAQLKPTEIQQISGVDLVLGAKEKFHLFDFIQDFHKRDYGHSFVGGLEDLNEFKPSFSSDERTRAFLKVQDGCDYPCTYCTIPLARGKSRSPYIQQVIEQAQRIIDKGHHEIVLTGVNVGDFHNDKKETFFDLLQELEKLSMKRIRISSIEPNLLTDEIIEFVAHSKVFMPHFHIPLQSGSSKILRLMKRRYKKELYEQRVQKIKDLLPHACIGVDVIVGFPNETDEDFQETYQFLHELPISYLHVFSYSSRENTLAAKMDNQVSNEIKNLRSKILRNLSEKKKHQFATDFLNLEKEILLENKIQNGMRMGHTDNYLKVWIPLDESEGFIKVKLAQHIGSDEFLGEVIHNGNIMENKLLNFI
jgi:threonylcarbamoyladenosine tRNA methylthiotransferase MtaB